MPPVNLKNLGGAIKSHRNYYGLYFRGFWDPVEGLCLQEPPQQKKIDLPLEKFSGTSALITDFSHIPETLR